jgi:hypothetical protein
VTVQFLPTVANAEGMHAVLNLAITTLAPGVSQSVDLTGESIAFTPGTVAADSEPASGAVCADSSRYGKLVR